MFRRVVGTEIWHSVPTCPFWPLKDFEEKEHPTIGHRCRRCLQLELENKHIDGHGSEGDSPKK